ncbi:Alpha-amylase A [Holothuria leucospilota]|uniref:Alpha-amylase n=1 Tax=Holothuria leucospilota TaxID=206669 RepID=A0A9Q1CA93_HOLLE|nr:Alpha-amylase A [Holothuria leucospilota]
MKVLILLLLFTAVKGQYDLNMAYGRSTMVHLFEWSWDDIASECENFLAPYDYGGVQVSPPSEHYLSWDNVWWDRYQPVSYKLDCKKGDEAAFRNMVTRCNNVGVRIYVDAVINHMAAGGSTSSGSSSYDAGAYSFPAVPYSSWDFNVPNGYCSSPDGGVNDYGNANEVRNCNLLGLTDLSMGKSYVQDKIVEYLNNLISMGVAGFRVDAVKHMWPDHLKSIYDRLDNLDSSIFGFGKRPFFVQEVIDMGYGEPITASEYTYIGRVTEFKYSDKIGTVAKGYDQMKWLVNFGEDWGFMSRDYALVFVDNHDNQRNHGGGGNIVTHTSSKQYKIASTFMLGYDYGVTRVMSSFFFSDNDYGGPSNSPYFTSDGACNVNSGWVCEHRWREIRNMVGFRKTCEGQGVNNWWDNGNNMIAFSRGSEGFIAINGDSYQMSEWLQTGMPAGTYCDVISGDKSGNSCTGNAITVYSDGKAYFEISNSSDSPIIAIHANSKL